MWLTVYGVFIQLSIIIECRYIDSLCRDAMDMCGDEYMYIIIYNIITYTKLEKLSNSQSGKL